LDTFTNSLATARNPSFLAPLGHQVDPAGPSGHVSGLASPVAPQAISSGPELPVAARPVESSRSSLASVVQRALAPRMWLSDSVAPSASTDQSTSPAPPSPADSPTVDQGGEFSPLPGPRHLEPAASPAPFSLTSAPDPGEFSLLPVVSSVTPPAASPAPVVSAVPTVSRLESGALQEHPGGQHSAGPAGHETPGVAVSDTMSPGVVQRSASTDAPSTVSAPGPGSDLTLPVAPLLGDTASDGQVAGGNSATDDGATSGNDAPAGAAEVGQRHTSVGGPATAPEAHSVPAAHSVSSITDRAHVVQRSATAPAFQPTVAPSSFSSGFVSASVQRSPGLGAPLMSAPSAPGVAADRSVPQRLSADQPLTVADRSGSTGTAQGQSSTAGGNHDVNDDDQPAPAGPAPTQPGAASETRNEAPMLGFAELMRVIDEGSLSGPAPTET